MILEDVALFEGRMRAGILTAAKSANLAALAVLLVLGSGCVAPHPLADPDQTTFAYHQNGYSQLALSDSVRHAASTNINETDSGDSGVRQAAYQLPSGDKPNPFQPNGKKPSAPMPPERLPLPRESEPGLAKEIDGPETGLTLDQVINTTLLADPQLRAGFQAISQANGDALTASLRPNPNFEIAQTLLPLTEPFTVDREGGPPQLDVMLTFPIDWFIFGKRAAEMMAANLEVRVSEAEYADLVRVRVLEAATAFYDVLEAKALVELAELDVENFQRVEQITQAVVDGGNLPRIELSRVRLDRLQAEQGLRDARNELVAAVAALRATMGLGDADPDFDVAGSLDDIAVQEFPDVEDALAMAVENRPDITALQRKIAQANAEAESERRQAFPEVTPMIGYTRQFQEKAIGFPDANSFGLGLEMGLPIFDRNQGNRRRAASVIIQQH